MSNGLQFVGIPPFPQAAAQALGNVQQRKNLTHATHTIRAKRAAVVGELEDWEQLRESGAAIKDHTMAHLADYLEQAEEAVTRAGGTVHWARDAAEACAIVAGIAEQHRVRELVKIKSMVTMEIGLNEALAERGIAAIETDLAELIVQLGDDLPSHILVPAIHRNRAEIRELFLRTMPEVPDDITDEPRVLAEAARTHLREKFLTTNMAVSGGNFLVAETGTVVIVESEGNGRMCLTLPDVLVSVVGIEKVVPTWRDLEVFFQLLPRSSTGERMNPYTSTWTGVTPGDGPQEVHLVLLDNGRSRVLAEPATRETLRCIRCSACLNVCPVYERVGGHAYGSVYPGPIGAVLTPALLGVEPDQQSAKLPFASSLCGACYDVCPVQINIPDVLIHLRGKVVDAKRGTSHGIAERAAMRSSRVLFADGRLMAAATRGATLAGRLTRRPALKRLPAPLSGWTDARDVPMPQGENFRTWWRRRSPADVAAALTPATSQVEDR